MAFNSESHSRSFLDKKALLLAGLLVWDLDLDLTPVLAHVCLCQLFGLPQHFHAVLHHLRMPFSVVQVCLDLSDLVTHAHCVGHFLGLAFLLGFFLDFLLGFFLDFCCGLNIQLHFSFSACKHLARFAFLCYYHFLLHQGGQYAQHSSFFHFHNHCNVFGSSSSAQGGVNGGFVFGQLDHFVLLRVCVYVSIIVRVVSTCKLYFCLL